VVTTTANDQHDTRQRDARHATLPIQEIRVAKPNRVRPGDDEWNRDRDALVENVTMNGGTLT